MRSSALVCELFKRHGIGLVTLQPEFDLAPALGKTGRVYILTKLWHTHITYNIKLPYSKELDYLVNI